jgi:hypothetical protein
MNNVLFLLVILVMQMLLLLDNIIFVLINNLLSALLVYIRVIKNNRVRFSIVKDIHSHLLTFILGLILSSIICFMIKESSTIKEGWNYFPTFLVVFYSYFTFVMWMFEKLRLKIFTYLFGERKK